MVGPFHCVESGTGYQFGENDANFKYGALPCFERRRDERGFRPGRRTLGGHMGHGNADLPGSACRGGPGTHCACLCAGGNTGGPGIGASKAPRAAIIQ
jgi:hypothetical protein